jgi:hypothetical protein
MPEENASARVKISFYDDNWTGPDVGWNVFSNAPPTPVLLRHAARALDELATFMEGAPVVDELPLESDEGSSTG